jgi:membrane associated rhomboid family serine protease
MFRPRRWCYITTAIISVNVLLFLATHERLQQEANQYLEIESRTLSIAAIHRVQVTPAQQSMVDAFRNSHPQEWERMASVQNAAGNLDEVSEKMKDLGRQLDTFQRDSLTARFSVFPPHSSLLSGLTANFLHRDWTHLIFNICFLWLVGGILEDLYGRPMFAGIAVVCALAGVWSYTIAYSSGSIPLIGASGLISALMGVYLIRFPKNTIEQGTALWEVRPHLIRLSSPVYIVFPTWLLGLAFWGKSAGETTNAAYWAQAGALVFGIALGSLLWVTGIESYWTHKIEAEVGLSADPHIAKAAAYLENGDIDSAIDSVIAHIAQKPYSVEPHEMLVSLYNRKGNVLTKYLKALEALCEVQLRAANPESAWENYETYLKAGGRNMPAETWFQLARFAENQGKWERAVTEYEEFARAWPDERSSVLAMISAGRINLQQFGRQEEAKRLYTAAQNSPVPHSDWDDVIRKGLEKASGGAALKVETRELPTPPTAINRLK